MKNILQADHNSNIIAKIRNADNFTFPQQNTGWQTWLVKIQDKTETGNGLLIDVISLETNKKRIIKQIHPVATALYQHNQNAPTMCTATYENADLFTCLPGRYAADKPVAPTKNASVLTPLDKLSAFLEEALWQNLFQWLVILSSSQNHKVIRATLSTPVQARIIAFYDLDDELSPPSKHS